MKKNLYVDIDDTFVDTENYLRTMFIRNGYKVPEKLSVYEYISGGEFDFLFKEGMSDYTLIPRMPGAEDAIKILSTEFNVVFLSCCTYREEVLGKKKLARALGKELILCEGRKSHIPMENAIFIDDNVQHLINSDAAEDNKYLFFNIYNVPDIMANLGFSGHVVSNWYDITNKLMGVSSSDAELRRYIHKRISEFSAGCGL